MVRMRGMSTPGKRAMVKLKGVLRNFKGTMNLGLRYNCSERPMDAALTFCRRQCCSWPRWRIFYHRIHIYYIFHFAAGPLDWKSQEQSIVALSTVEVGSKPIVRSTISVFAESDVHGRLWTEGCHETSRRQSRCCEIGVKLCVSPSNETHWFQLSSNKAFNQVESSRVVKCISTQMKKGND